MLRLHSFCNGKISQYKTIFLVYFLAIYSEYKIRINSKKKTLLKNKKPFLSMNGFLFFKRIAI
jgi:hypothetical protein